MKSARLHAANSGANKLLSASIRRKPPIRGLHSPGTRLFYDGEDKLDSRLFRADD